jgi:hypothetical protein
MGTPAPAWVLRPPQQESCIKSIPVKPTASCRCHFCCLITGRHALKQRAAVPHLRHMQPAVTQLGRAHTTHDETREHTQRMTHTLPSRPKPCVVDPGRETPLAEETTSTARQHTVLCTASHTEQGRNTAAAVLHCAEPQLLLQEGKAARVLS